MLARSLRRWCAVVAIALVASACATSKDDDTASPSSSAKEGAKLTASARGVSASTIKVGFAYIDLETLAKSGIIKIDHGPYADIIKALVDDVNAHGGVNGRTLELVTAKYSPIGNTEQLAACTKLTEDEKVFVVLNGLLGDNNLCITQQHATALVGDTYSAALRAKAKAPWITYTASRERSIDALVTLLDKNDLLKGSTIGVYAAQATNKPLIDLGVNAIEDAGYKVADVGFMDAPAGDTQAATAADKVIAERMKNKGVDTLVNVGQFQPAADFDAAGFHPKLFTVSTGDIAAAAFTNPLGKFPLVAGVASGFDDTGYPQTKEFQRCRDVWKRASGKDIKSVLQEDLDGKSSGNIAMQIACTTLQIFVAGAKAAGPNLTNETFERGVASLGKIELANTATASYGVDKFDGQDSFQLGKFDPTWKEGEGKNQFIALGSPITQTK
jgi:ABC-type branched-subunit amino acid transport system substrate-binding protein